MAGIRITWYPEPGTWHPCPIPTFQILTKHYRKTCQALKKSKESWAMTQSQTGRDPTGVRPVRCAQRAGIRIGSSQRNRRTERYRLLRRAGAWPNPFGPGRSPIRFGATPGVLGEHGYGTWSETSYQGACASRGSAAMRDPKEWLRDILKAIAAIECHASIEKRGFKHYDIVQGLFLHHHV